jgi:predicted nuclease of predicted toxin-antitoxin system
VSLRLYLDDCANSDLLADLLRRAGHDVVRPGDAGIAWQNDDIHFAYASANGLTLITKNPADFLARHQIDPNHAGIFAIYLDNDKT